MPKTDAARTYKDCAIASENSGKWWPVTLRACASLRLLLAPERGSHLNQGPR